MHIEVCPKQLSFLISKISILSKSKFVLLSAQKGTIRFFGANDQVQVKTQTLECNVVREGNFGFDVSVLKDLVSGLSAFSSVTLKSDEKKNGMSVNCPETKAKYFINGCSETEVMVELANAFGAPKAQIFIEPEMLAWALSAVTKTAAKNDVRYELNGICVEFVPSKEGNYLLFIGTDGHRLNMVEVPVQGIGVPSEFIIPNNPQNQFVDNIVRMAAGQQSKVELLFMENSVTTVFEGERITSLYIDRKYPNWRAIVDGDLGSYKAITVNKGTCSSVLRRLQVMTRNEPSHTVKGILKGNSLTLSAMSKLNEYSGSETIEVKNPENHKMTFGFNSTYLMDMLNLSVENETTLWLCDEATPIRYSREGIIGVVMLCRL
ncbi:hypothetical protein HUO09_16960 [Vibrio sp. Y2-5]|uniref:DNA polymerase III subunit beta n=1 Tax=Vibrio sp. Y2-5 TaxID=2743977 RepID=UPI001660EB0E|nr:DNA polymerase III subunit beta [Vibrio sp. Y2-5]MBD0788046.1 hypothetical protein [Vibrio sp. Y2-5]